MSAVRIAIGMFVHNEERNVPGAIANLSHQSVFKSGEYSAQAHILCNGCSDGSVPLSRAEVDKMGLSNQFTVHEIVEPGKSRTWNKYVHDICDGSEDVILFMDADIEILDANVIEKIVDKILSDPEINACSSRPVKDINFNPALRRGLTDTLLGAAAGGLDDWSNSICGQLYGIRASVARTIWIPAGLPVEDGFVAAMIATDCFEGVPAEHACLRISGDPEAFHVYKSEREIGALIKHQVRIVIGSAINSLIYSDLWRLNKSDRDIYLAEAAVSDGWLSKLIRSKLPNVTYGYVPWHFLFKRIHRASFSSILRSPKRLGIILAGFGFDAIVYLTAQYLMFRGVGAGHW